MSRVSFRSVSIAAALLIPFTCAYAAPRTTASQPAAITISAPTTAPLSVTGFPPPPLPPPTHEFAVTGFPPPPLPPPTHEFAVTGFPPPPLPPPSHEVAVTGFPPPPLPPPSHLV